MLKLLIVDDEGNQREVNVEKEEVTIGRTEDNTIRLTERNVSRSHARLVRDGDELFLEDAGSSFGVKVNGIRVLHRTAIHAGDEIGIGDFVLSIATQEGIGFDAHSAGTVVSIVSIPEEVQGRFRVMSGEFEGKTFAMEQSPTSFGRDESNHYIISHDSVAGEHARVYFRNGGFELEAASEMARIWVNGKRCETALLHHDDEVKFGDISFVYLDSPKARMTARITEVALPVKRWSGSKKILIAVGSAILVYGIALGLGIVGPNILGDEEDSTRLKTSREDETTPSTSSTETVGVSFDRAELEELNLEGTKLPDIEQVPLLLQDAKDAMSRKQWYEAIELYRIILEHEPNHVDAGLKLERAKLEMRRGKMITEVDDLIAEKNYVKAWNLVEQYREAIPEESNYYNEMVRRRTVVGELAGPFILERARLAQKRKDFSFALQLVDQVLEMQPDNPDAKPFRNEILNQQAQAQKTAGTRTKTSAKRSIKSKKLSRKERRSKAMGLYQEGRRAQLGGRTALAITRYKEALRTDSRFPKAHKALGILYAARGDSARAIKHYKSYIKGNPKAGDRKTVESAILRLGGTL